MKYLVVIICLFLAGLNSFAKEWKPISSAEPGKASVRLVETRGSASFLHYDLPGFYMKQVSTPQGEAYIVSCDGLTTKQEAGNPDLPQKAVSVLIPDNSEMEAEIVSSEYTDYQGFLIAPSKGVISRETNPSDVPWTFGGIYNQNRFYPENLTALRIPHQVREFRGQTILFTPFQYNPVKRLLRVYHNVTLVIHEKGAGTNSNHTLYAPEKKVNRSLATVLGSHFINFDATNYTSTGDYGNLLVICYTPWLSAMQPYIDWKNASGYPAEMVSTDSVGITSAQIKAFITNYYNTKGLTHVLLVGDKAQIPTNNYTGLGGPSDNAYGYIAGDDHYSDVFIGRFSAETVAHVQTQVQRTLDYEINPQFLADDWYSTVTGIASDQGPGDDEEMDYEHVRNQQTQLLAYKYTWNPELFDGSQGGHDAPGNPTPALVATEVNNGTGLILYTGHGSSTSWGTSGFSNNNVNQLVNQGKLPFIWSVACVNGNFLSTTCFAEAWLRATQNGQPTGAVAFLGSTINQSWNSPMEGQDEMTDILAESYSANIKRTFAGLSINGCMKMIDSYGIDGQNMADTWTVFGDPTIMVRTSAPQTMMVIHDTVVYNGDSALMVLCDTEGARVTLTNSGSFLSTGIVENGSVALSYPASTPAGDTLHLVVTGYNTIPYQKNIFVEEKIILPVTANFTGIPEQVVPGATVAFSDTSSGSVITWSWSFPGGVPSSSTLQHPVVTYPDRGIYNVTLVVGNGLTYDTLTKTGYITCDWPTVIPSVSSSEIVISPNPNDGNFTVTLPSTTVYNKIEIFTLTGTAIGTRELSSQDSKKSEFRFGNIPSGFYLLVVSGGDRPLITKMIVK